MKIAAILTLSFIALSACQSSAPPGPARPSAAATSDDPQPFDETRNATADVDSALVAARDRGTRVLLVLGANWCHDSRGLAAKFEKPNLAALIAKRYELVYVDVGHRDRNLDVAARFGVHELIGTPTVLILSPGGALLNGDSVNDWRDAASRTPGEVLAYFRKWSEATGE
ncbi:MAG TPA: thioredoxin family protein [Parvularculaceae bacterium]|nr:thioredoxin family protein [Parvularculaceae bacterium]